jgi:hypothetical protein
MRPAHRRHHPSRRSVTGPECGSQPAPPMRWRGSPATTAPARISRLPRGPADWDTTEDTRGEWRCFYLVFFASPVLWRGRIGSHERGTYSKRSMSTGKPTLSRRLSRPRGATVSARNGRSRARTRTAGLRDPIRIVDHIAVVGPRHAVGFDAYRSRTAVRLAILDPACQCQLTTSGFVGGLWASTRTGAILYQSSN